MRELLQCLNVILLSRCLGLIECFTMANDFSAMDGPAALTVPTELHIIQIVNQPLKKLKQVRQSSLIATTNFQTCKPTFMFTFSLLTYYTEMAVFWIVALLCVFIYFYSQYVNYIIKLCRLLCSFKVLLHLIVGEFVKMS